MFALSQEQYKEYIKEVAARLQKEKEYITKLDADTGDGDHWLNMHIGFQKLVEKLPEWDGLSYAELFEKIAMTLMSAMGGSSGILYGSAYLRASKLRREAGLLKAERSEARVSEAEWSEARLPGAKLPDVKLPEARVSKAERSEVRLPKAQILDDGMLNEEGLDTMLSGWSEAIAERGDVRPGQKTMLDAVYPAAIAYHQARIEGKESAVCLAEMTAAAKQGAESTRKMEAVKGRASYREDKSVGYLDPGAVTMALQIECLGNVIMERGDVS